MIKRFPISRRAFLGGSSVAIALPFLEALSPPVRGAEGEAPKRFSAWFSPNGVVRNAWDPQNMGSAFDPSAKRLTAMFAPFKDDMLLVSGLNSRGTRTAGGMHAGGTVAFLTGYGSSSMRDGQLNTQADGPSMEQFLAENLGQQTKVPALVLAANPSDATGNCPFGWSCEFFFNMSYSAKPETLGKVVPQMTDPKKVFDLLFAGFDPNSSSETISRRDAFRTSILDLVKEDAKRLQPKLSYRDRGKLDEYFTGVREIERRIEVARQGGNGSTPGACDPSTIRLVPEDTNPGPYMDTLADLQVLAFQCDINRYQSYFYDNGGLSKGRDYTFIDAPGVHHTISHTNDFKKLEIIHEFIFQRLAYFIKRLSETEDFDGRRLIDNTLVWWSSDITNGKNHSQKNMPAMLFGHAAGFKMGQAIKYQGDDFAELNLAIMNQIGMPELKKWGEGAKKPLAGLF